jgi:hypothetical protein
MKLMQASMLGLLMGGVGATVGSCGGNVADSTFSTGSGNTGTGTGTGTSSGAGGAGISTTGGSTVTGVIGTGTTGTTGSGGSDINPDASCGVTKQGTSQIPTDLFILEDKSGSMDCPASDSTCDQNPPMPPVQPTRWTAFTNAVTTFVNSPNSNGLSVGLGFFPLTSAGGGRGGGDCNLMAYSTPAVPIAPLPGNAMPIQMAIGANMPGNGTPTLPALQGAIAIAKAYTMNTPGRTAAVLLVTDGNPNDCNSTTQAVATLAGQAFMGTPSIRTYVVGLGVAMNLDSVALAGSGGATHYFPAMGDVSGALVAALTTITGMVTCNYAIPKGADPGLVNVQVTVGQGGMPQKIGKVNDAASCGMLGGWYYDNPTKPTQIILCPQSCTPIQMTPNSGVEVLYGCPSIPPA